MKYNNYTQGKVCPVCQRLICNEAMACHKHQAGRMKGSEHPRWKGGKYKIKHPCPDCGRPIWYYSKHCPLCAIKYKPSQAREKNWNWKGGRIKDGDGYILIKNWTHHRSKSKGYVLEHILVWEQAHNKLLPDSWEVHHYNGIKDDNRPSNLFATSEKKHKLIIPTLQKRIQELEALILNQHQLL